jgi:protein-disulfide isomerase
MRDMKRTVLFLVLALAAASVLAADVPAKTATAADEKIDRAIRDSLPLCSGSKIMQADLQHAVPSNMTATLVRVESERPSCNGQYVGVVSKEGGFYLGTPWFLDGEQGSIEEKLKSFTWRNMQENFTLIVDRQKTREGLYRVTLMQTTERGKLPMEGEVDPAGTVFFLGHFRPLSEDVRTSRAKAFEPFIAGAPAEGAAKPQVTIVEFSDFECPSCRRAAAYLDPILSKYSDKVRYVRYDLPLIGTHPWAFAAAVAGRAVHRQKPELFRDYKTQVYTNQEKLNAFNFDDFAENFAKDRELDMQKFAADIASAELKDQILKGVGTALSNDIRATPSYLVNGIIVDAGVEGKDLEAYVASLLK